jgi:pimeloyl-ACP methyl ester carboxylesterase
VNSLPESQITRSADGTNIGYAVYGDGPLDLMFLGGGPFALELMWDDPGFMRFARRLSTFSRTIWFDPRGWGGSEGDPRDSYVGVTSDADVVAVLDAVGAEQVAMVGWSLTGSRGIDFSVTHPERVRALVLIDSCAYYIREDDYPWGYPRESLDRVVASLQEAWGTAVDVNVTAPSRIADERFRAWYARIRRTSTGPTNLAEGFRGSLEWDVRALLASISAPTLVLHREGDRFIHLGAGRYLAEHIPGAKFVVLPGDDHQFFVGDTDALADEIEEFLTGSRSGAGGDVVTKTILFTDIAASTEHQARVGQREWSRLTDQHDALVRAVLARHRGHEVKTTGDGFLATFDGIGRGLRCAAEILAAAKPMGLDLRAGVNTGDVEVRGDDIAGLSVSIAKRVCDLAAPGEVMVSEVVRGLMVGSGFGFLDRGERELKGVPGMWRLYGVAS